MEKQRKNQKSRKTSFNTPGLIYASIKQPATINRMLAVMFNPSLIRNLTLSLPAPPPGIPLKYIFLHSPQHFADSIRKAGINMSCCGIRLPSAKSIPFTP